MNDRDYINTQIFDTDNTGLAIAQDVLVTMAITGMVQGTAEDAIYHLGGKQSLKQLSKKSGNLVTMKTANRLEKMTVSHWTNKAYQQVASMFSGKSAKKVSETSGKALATQGSKLIARKAGEEAAEQGVKIAAKQAGKEAGKAAVKAGMITAGGCALGPAGCAAGSVIAMAVFIADMAFTIYSTILDIKDSKGTLILWHRDFVDQVANDYKMTLTESAVKLGKPGLMEEEVEFFPELFVYDFDENTIPYMDENNEWAKKYLQYFDEYIRDTAKVKDGWRERLQAKDLTVGDLITAEEAEAKAKDDKKKITFLKNVSITTGIFIIIITCLCLFLLFFIII